MIYTPKGRAVLEFAKIEKEVLHPKKDLAMAVALRLEAARILESPEESTSFSSFVCLQFEATEFIKMCEACPVAAKTGWRFCLDTSLEDYALTKDISHVNKFVDILLELAKEIENAL